MQFECVCVRSSFPHSAFKKWHKWIKTLSSEKSVIRLMWSVSDTRMLLFLRKLKTLFNFLIMLYDRYYLYIWKYTLRSSNVNMWSQYGQIFHQYRYWIVSRIGAKNRYQVRTMNKSRFVQKLVRLGNYISITMYYYWGIFMHRWLEA